MTLMSALLGFLLFIVFIGFLVLALFSVNAVVIDTMERQREFVNIRANGGTKATIFKLIGIQIYSVVFLSFLFNFILVPPVTKALINTTTEDFATFKTTINPATYFYGLIVIVFGISVGVWLAIRFVMKLHLAEAIRAKFQT